MGPCVLGWVEQVYRRRSKRCQEHKAYQLGISRMHPECSDSGRSDRSVAADVLLRQEPDEEEDEEEGEGDGKEKQDDDNDDTTDDGYSE
jgi:hypothetical protein